jgi:CcmD family protein
MQTSSPNSTQESSPADRAQEFVADTGGRDTSSAETLLVVAYIGMWLAIFAFVWLTRRKQGALDARLDALEKSLNRAEKADPSA